MSEKPPEGVDLGYRGIKPQRKPPESRWKQIAGGAAVLIAGAIGGREAVNAARNAHEATPASTPTLPQKDTNPPREQARRIPEAVLQALPQIASRFLDEHVLQGERRVERALEHNRHPSARDIEEALTNTESLYDSDLFAYLGTNRSDITSLINGDLMRTPPTNRPDEDPFLVSHWLRNAAVREQLKQRVITEAKEKLRAAARRPGDQRTVVYVAVLEHLLRPVAQASPAGNPHNNLR
ncbi:hypothetical protein KBD61_06445 [Patescibacteria group bacterium]|nr:hypothetical protein [Patescibacteria group bacterium]MBP9710623.1 hypothetical protein [Patescibacteria group bacterium]